MTTGFATTTEPVTVTTTTHRARSRTIERRIETEYARDRLAKALHEVVLDSVAFGPCDLPTRGDREWIRSAIAMPIQEATDAALRVLARRLTVAMDNAPDGLLDRLDVSHGGQEFGWE
jgi:hypothetical protein